MSSPTSSPSTASFDPADTETPLFFASGDRPLYAVFHGARKARPGAPVLVVCHSLGVEQLTDYRNEVLVARAAAEAGVHAFRYHARGHGDSGGDFADVTLERLIEDAVAAAGEALRLSGATQVVWLGVRFGALAAAGALARRDDAAGFALWEPVHRPADSVRGQLRGMLFSEVAHGARPAASVDELLAQVASSGRVDVHGYYLHSTLLESARDADLGALLAPWRGPTLVVQVQGRPRLAAPHAAFASALETQGARVETALIREEPGWHFMSNPAWQSAELVDLTARWLDGVA